MRQNRKLEKAFCGESEESAVEIGEEQRGREHAKAREEQTREKGRG